MSLAARMRAARRVFMEQLIASSAGVLAMVASIAFFQVGLVTGAWKYFCVRSSPVAEAPVYVNIAHRAALMYAFASLLLAILASLSVFDETVNLLAVAFPLFYFSLAVVRYIQLGITRSTDNQHLNPPNRGGELALLLSLIVAEIGGFTVLSLGFLLRVFG